MKHAMRGFGIALSEPQARALTFHPFIEQVEEDGYAFISAGAAPAFDFARTARGAIGATSATACPWVTTGSNGVGYFACSYSNDAFWWLDRLDNTGLIYGTKAYAYNSMGTGVRAYVVDSGVWYGHTEFDTRVTTGANMTVDPDVNDPVGDGEPATEEPPILPDYSPANDPAATAACNNSPRPRSFITAPQWRRSSLETLLCSEERDDRSREGHQLQGWRYFTARSRAGTRLDPGRHEHDSRHQAAAGGSTRCREYEPLLSFGHRRRETTRAYISGWTRTL